MQPCLTPEARIPDFAALHPGYDYAARADFAGASFAALNGGYARRGWPRVRAFSRSSTGYARP
jgi:hypothetical protein